MGEENGLRYFGSCEIVYPCSMNADMILRGFGLKKCWLSREYRGKGLIVSYSRLRRFNPNLLDYDLGYEVYVFGPRERAETAMKILNTLQPNRNRNGRE